MEPPQVERKTRQASLKTSMAVVATSAVLLALFGRVARLSPALGDGAYVLALVWVLGLVLPGLGIARLRRATLLGGAIQLAISSGYALWAVSSDNVRVFKTLSVADLDPPYQRGSFAYAGNTVTSEVTRIGGTVEFIVVEAEEEAHELDKIQPDAKLLYLILALPPLLLARWIIRRWAWSGLTRERILGGLGLLIAAAISLIVSCPLWILLIFHYGWVSDWQR